MAKGRRKRGKQGRRKRPSSARVVEGRLEFSNPHRILLHTEEGFFVVPRRGLREGMHGDTVRATLVPAHGREGYVAYVQSVLERATTTFLGEFHDHDPLGVIVPLSSKIGHDFFVVPEDRSPERLGVADGDIVVARIVGYPTRKEAGVVTLERKVGTSEQLDMNMEHLIASYDLPIAFPDAVAKAAEALSLDVEAALTAEPERRDLRELVCCTVDPTDARDFDDAVSARRLDDGGYEVGIHIADVSHYLSWDNSLDLEARSRGCSVYLADRVIPMLPERLSNDLCSLRPHEDRLAMTVLAELDATGKVTSFEAFPSAIRSSARLDYATCDLLLQDTSATCAQHPELSGEVAEALLLLNEVAHLRHELRIRRGALDFVVPEARVVLDDAGRPVRAQLRERSAATELIEEAMLIANECVAQLLTDAQVTCAYRVHEVPAPEKLVSAVEVLHELDYAKGKAGERLAAGDPFAAQEVLRACAGTSEEYLVSQLILRAQKRACYEPYNQGHYALAAPAYCHFTSPIRRYPDVCIHRALKAVLANERTNKAERAQEEAMPQICAHASERERRADKAERQAQKIKMAELYLSQVGEAFSGIVVGVHRRGLFVMLDDTGAEGLLSVDELGHDYFLYDEDRLTLTGESSGKVWRLGMRVAVRVRSCDPMRGFIDFARA